MVAHVPTDAVPHRNCNGPNGYPCQGFQIGVLLPRRRDILAAGTVTFR